MKEIPLTQGFFALVDDEDFEWLSQWKWNAKKGGKTWYARRQTRNGEPGTSVQMARAILGLGPGDKREADHIDRNGLNNCRSNLRIATRVQQRANTSLLRNNTSGCRGVRFHAASSKWHVMFQVNQRKHYLGLFEHKQDAINAYKAELKRLGEERPE